MAAGRRAWKPVTSQVRRSIMGSTASLVAILAALAVAFGAGHALGSAWPLGVGALAAILVAIAGPLARPQLVSGELVVTSERVELGGVPLVERADIERAWVVPGDHTGEDRILVRIDRRRGDTIELRLGSIAEARGVVEALGMDARSKSQTFTALAPSRPHFLARCATTMLAAVPLIAGLELIDHAKRAGFAHATAVGFACVVLSALPLVAMFIPTRATVGADGVLLRWLWQRTFIPISDIEDVVPVQESFIMTSIVGLRIDRRSGPPVTLVVGTEWNGKRYAASNAATLTQRDVIEERIREAVAQRDAHVAEPLRLPVRGSRSAGEWLEGLRKLAAPGGYRAEAAPEAPRLWELLEDPAQDPSRRVAAAVLLGRGIDDDGRKRLRVAADATAAPKLRIALEAAAADDDAALTEAVATLDDGAAAEAHAEGGSEPS